MNIKVGDKIHDFTMSRVKGVPIYPVVTKIISSEKMLVDHAGYPTSYPHSFFEFERGIKFELLG